MVFWPSEDKNLNQSSSSLVNFLSSANSGTEDKKTSIRGDHYSYMHLSVNRTPYWTKLNQILHT